MVTKPVSGQKGWDVPLNAALDDLQTQVNAKLPLSGGTMTGPITGVNGGTTAFTTDSTARSAFFKTTSPTDHAVTVYQASTSGVDVAAALNVTSDNPQTSSMYLAGTETNRGTLKVAHHGYADGSDSGAAAISVDLQTTQGGSTGTAAQGLFITSTTDTTPAGNAITVRYNSADRFVVKGSTGAGNGVVGIGVAIGHTPSGMLEIAQKDTTTIGLAMSALASGTDMVNLKDSGGNQRFQVNNSGNLVLRATMFNTGAIQGGATSADLGGSAGFVISMKNVTTPPSTNPTGGVIVYADGGVLKSRDASGNVVNLTRQTVTGSRGGNAALASLLTALAAMGLITDSTTA